MLSKAGKLAACLVTQPAIPWHASRHEDVIIRDNTTGRRGWGRGPTEPRLRMRCKSSAIEYSTGLNYIALNALCMCIMDACTATRDEHDEYALQCMLLCIPSVSPLPYLILILLSARENFHIHSY
jgi:hypothetical protein